MIAKLWLTIILGILCIPYSMNATEGKKEKPKYWHFEIGPEYSHLNFHIKATDTTEGNTFHGRLWGLTASLDYRDPNGLYLNLNASTDKNPIFSHNRLDRRREFKEHKAEGRIGYTFSFKCLDSWKFTPYIGFGYDTIIFTHIGAQSLKARSMTYYVPFGIIALYKINDMFSVATHPRYQAQVDTTVTLQQFKHGRWHIHEENGFIWDFPLIYHYTYCHFDGNIILSPYWRLLRKGSGKAVACTTCNDVPIAGQIYHYWGLRLLFGVNF